MVKTHKNTNNHMKVIHNRNNLSHSSKIKQKKKFSRKKMMAHIVKKVKGSMIMNPLKARQMICSNNA